jgi:hypothetical protein
MRKYRYATVQVDVDLDEFETNMLVEELADRYDELTADQRKKIRHFIPQEVIEGYIPNNLDHKMKFELFLSHIDDFFYTEFEKRLTATTDYIKDENGE